MKNKTRYVVLLGIIVVLAGLFAWYKLTPGPYDNLATCLTEKEVTFYGAFWCSACQAQKQAFSKSVTKLPYVECSAPNGKDTLPLCEQLDIKKYPTWAFPDGTRQQGIMTPDELATKMSCPIN